MTFQDKLRNPNCELCKLHEEAEFVCLMGVGKRKSKIMVVGEAPGAREDEQHEAFVGKAGELLNSLLGDAGLTRDDVYITNAAKCRPPNNRTPERSEVKTCVSNYLVPEIGAINPQFIVLLGNVALQGALKRSGITKHRGRTVELDGVTYFPTFHPAAGLRNPRLLPDLRADFARFGRLVRNEAQEIKTRIKIVRTPQELKWLLRKLKAAEVISYDIETYTDGASNLQEWHGDDSHIASIAFAWAPGHAATVPLYNKSSPFRNHVPRILKTLKPYLERTDCKYVAQNGKFDNRWLAAKGIFVPQTFDTMLAAHMLDENRPKGLKSLSQVILGVDAYDVGDDLADASAMPLGRLCKYNALDADYTLRLYYIFREQLLKEPRIMRVFTKLMMPASNSLTKTEAVGIWMDQRRWAERYEVCVENRDKLITYMKRYVSEDKREEFNFNSPIQIAEWLFNDLGLSPIEKTAKGANSTKESVLLQLQKENKAVKALLKYRKWNKYITTYLGPWKEFVDDRSRIHAGYKLHGTVTGRLSSSDPNLQNVPRNPFIRGILGAPPGWKLVEADYSQVELRVAAMLANERTMLRSFAMGEDIHMKTACSMTGKVPEDISSEERKKAKAVNFGFLYGMGWEKFVTYARDNYDVEVSEKEARHVRDRFFETYPRLRPWHERQRRLANRYQRVHSPIGRVRHLTDVASGDKQVRAEAERQAINSPVQSFASDLMLLSLIRLDGVLRPQDARIVGSVHDALLFEVRDGALDETISTIREVMQDLRAMKVKFGADITVPIEVEIKVGQHWSEGKVVG